MRTRSRVQDDCGNRERATVGFDRLAAEGEAQAQPAPIASLLLEREKQVVRTRRGQPAALILHFDPHAIGAARTRSTTAVPGLVNLKAFCSRFLTTAASVCRSPETATPASTGGTTSRMPLARASSRAAASMSLMKSATAIVR